MTPITALPVAPLVPETLAAPWSVDLSGVHVVFGPGVLEQLGEVAQELGGRRALLVTDRGIVAAGYAERARGLLETAGLTVALFDGVEENPTTEHVARGVEAARDHAADLLIGLGGGSSMDCAKGINFLLTNGGRMEDYWGKEKANQPMLPSIGVPTTAGTGSEAQRFALISQPETHRKMACGDKKARFRTVLLDPDLLISVPREVAAVTGLDALSHAVESYVSRARNPISQLYARESWRLVEGSLEAYLEQPSDSVARSRMLLGAHLGGAAIEASMLGAAHACANPLTARYGIVHGTAVGLMLPHVVRFNGIAAGRLYGELVAAAGLSSVAGFEPMSARHADTLSARLEELYAAAGLESRLRDLGIEPAKLEALAEEAAEQWTGRFNPREAGQQEFRQLYEAAF